MRRDRPFATRFFIKTLIAIVAFVGGVFPSHVFSQSPQEEPTMVQINYDTASITFTTVAGNFRLRFYYPEYVSGLLQGIELLVNGNSAQLSPTEDTIAPVLEESELLMAGSSFGPPTIPPDRFTPPGPGWEWRPSNQPVGGPIGGWYNPGSGETLHPDLNHPLPKGPHWGWRDPYGNFWDYFPDPAPGQWKPSPSHPNNPSKPQPTFPPETLPPPQVIPTVPVIPVVPVIPTTPLPTTPVVPPVRPWMPWLPRFPLIPFFYFDIDNLGLDPTLA